jgi:hypothetical protein
VRYSEYWQKTISISEYSVKLSFKIEGEIKTFHDKQKLKPNTTTKPALQIFLKRILHTEDENKYSHEKDWPLNLKRRAEKLLESRIKLIAHMHIHTYKPLDNRNS